MRILRMHLPAPLQFEIDAATPRCEAIRAMGVGRFDQLAARLDALPNQVLSTGDPLAEFLDADGSSAARHRLLAQVAHDCRHSEVVLTVGIFELSRTNAPLAAPVLDAARVPWIPCAHSYLTIDSQRFDFSGRAARRVFSMQSLYEEVFVMPEDLAARMRSIQDRALLRWSEANGLSVATAGSVLDAGCAAVAAGLEQVQANTGVRS
jgi:hypothetical protein